MTGGSAFLAGLAEALESASSEASIEKASHDLLKASMELMGVSQVCMHMLNLHTATFDRDQVAFCNELAKRQPVSLDNIRGKSDGLSLAERAVVTRKPARVSNIAGLECFYCRPSNCVSRMVVPINRGEECVGILEYCCAQEAYFTQEHEDVARSAAAVFSLLYEKKNTLNFLTAVQRPVNFMQSEDEFLDDLLELIVEATGLPYIVIRELVEDDSLECIAQFGLPEDVDLAPLSKYPQFEKSVRERRSLACNSMSVAEAATLREIPAISDVKSFVVAPIVIGAGKDSEVFGTLSFGYPFEYDFSTLEVAQLESISNSIGVAITNLRHYRAATNALVHEMRYNAVLTAADVAQSVRHEINNYLDTASKALANMGHLLAKATLPNMQDVSERIDNIELQHARIGDALVKVKESMRTAARTVKDAPIKPIWESAFEMLEGRLKHENVQYDILGKNVTVHVNPDSLQRAFFLIIQNSTDAFRDFFGGKKTKKQKRRIDVRIENPGQGAEFLRLSYTDNAAGIDRSRIRCSEEDKDKPLEQLIFCRGATSKDYGTGYGLYLVRKMLDENRGSINLVSYRNGVQFEILLPVSQGKKAAW